MLSSDDKTQILKRFPDVELSYDRILHKKVHADLFLIQPKGKRAFLWFTYFRNTNVCIVLELNKNGNVSKLTIMNACFDSHLSFGTLLYGSYFFTNKTNYFSCEDILYYKSEDVSSYALTKKIHIMKIMFQQHIAQKSYNKNFVVIGMPCWCPNYEVALSNIPTLPYAVHGIRLYNTKNINKEFAGVILNKERAASEAVFRVKASLQADIYYLYCFEPLDKNIVYSTAAVPSYKRSVALNNIFRIIKENSNLDLLEESDDEDEFENISEDKYVHLEKSVTMKCVYNKRFRKWEPIDVIQKSGQKLVTRKEAQRLERNH